MGTRSEILKPMAPNILSAIFLGLVIILAIGRLSRAKVNMTVRSRFAPQPGPAIQRR